MVFGWVFAKLAERDLGHVPIEGTARRQLAEDNTLDEDRRFELACYSLTDGFLTSVMLRGPRAWRTNGKRKSASVRSPKA
jgi:hypothetical protein